jgi:hypothetical protein
MQISQRIKNEETGWGMFSGYDEVSNRDPELSGFSARMSSKSPH